MFHPVFICLLFSMNVLIKAETCTTRCYHTTNETDPLHFQNAVDTVDPVWKPSGQWLDLDCCADGFTDIEWYYHSLTNMTWRSWPWFSPCKYCRQQAPYRELCDKDQKLQFQSVSKQYTGRYRCNVSNSITGEYILREYKVVVEDCEQLEGSIEFFRKPDSTQQPAVLGSNQTYICAGYFGCPSSDPMRHANWSYVDAQGNTHYLLPDQDRHFDIVYNQSFPEITVGSTLTIIGVEEVDYQLKFQCNLATSQVQKEWNMTLHPPKTVKKWNIVKLLKIVCPVVGLFFLLLISLIVYCCCRPEIHYHVNSRTGRLRTRSVEEEGYHDACIIHSRENKEFVDEIKKPLLEKNYDIFTSQMTSTGSLETREAENIEKSMCAILVLSRTEIEDNRVTFMCGVAIQSRGNNILVIEKDDVERDSWRRAVEGEEAIRNLPQMCKTLKWRGRDKMSKRQIKNFHYSIRLRLPKPPVTKRDSQGRNNHGIQSDSSTSPLMFEQNTSVDSVSSVTNENSDSRGNQKRNGSRDVSDSRELVRLSSSGNHTLGSANDDLCDDVFTPSSALPMPNKHRHPQKQLSDDSGIVNSL